MPTRTQKAEETEADLTMYVVVTDAVTVSTGQRGPSGRPGTVRLTRGERLQAPAEHPSVLEHLALGGIVKESEVAEFMKALAKKGGVKRPHAQNKDERGYRITASGVVSLLSRTDDPALQPVEAILPVDAAALDTTPVTVE